MPKSVGRYGDFWSKVEKTSTCWLWVGGGDRYGTLTYHGRKMGAHRRSWEMANGRVVPAGLLVLHRCDVPRCVRPAHLFIGTQVENLADMKAKGRSHERDHRGAANPHAKLTQTQVQELRGLYRSGWRQVDLAERFGIQQPQVSRIVRSVEWA